MNSNLENRIGKAPLRKTIAEQTSVIESLETAIDGALERDPKLKDCLVMKAARAHLKGLMELRAEQVADEANASKRHQGNGNGASQTRP